MIDRQGTDQHPILDRSSASPAAEGDMLGEVSGKSASRSVAASVSAGIAAANAHPAKPADAGPRFPAEDGGRSLAEMAHRDLDAALQLLVERAQYITGATGAAIALRRGQHNDMLCRASTGSNAPELGALLSMEYGLSGECARTRQPLRCDDAERDARVNHEVCRQLGIASVVVMPIVSDEQVLGVFELFSGTARAFEPRDLSALQRLSEMVETAVKYAVTAQLVPVLPEAVAAEAPANGNEIAAKAAVEDPLSAIVPDLAPIPLQAVEKPELETPVLEGAKPEKPKPDAAPTPKKPLYWSAATQTQSNAVRPEEPAASIAVPLGLRNLQKCQACGFPVSQGRTFCVECEEKQWRGQRLPQPAAAAPAQASETGTESDDQRTRTPAVAVGAKAQNVPPAPAVPAVAAAQTSIASSSDVQRHIPDLPADLPASHNSTLFLSAAAPPESWFGANKYILGALLVVAIVIGAIVWLR
jgi:hypothetical protein